LVIPADWAFHYGLLVIIAATATLAGSLLPALNRLETANILSLYWSGLGLGCLGEYPAFFARLPLSRQYRFRASGPAQLSKFHRKLYWLSYVVIVSAVLLFGVFGSGLSNQRYRPVL
jgi:hypothetical protein